jgi:23S rRNA (uridine2552-2'-O)-methyltransferase
MKKGNTWQDHYTRRAKDENWLARSVYKLEEIDKKYRLIRPGNRVVDLGCSPGSWSQYCVKQVKMSGRVIGVDLNDKGNFSAPNFIFIQADILALDPDELARTTGEVDLVISDLAPGTTGIRITDEARSLELAKRAFLISATLLKKGGHFLCKIFEGGDFLEFKREISGWFEDIHLSRPLAVRKRSREIYLLGYIKK